MGFCTQLGAMSAKNWIQKKVNLGRTFLELFWPFIYGIAVGVAGWAS